MVLWNKNKKRNNSLKVADITENFSQTKSKRESKWPLKISPKVEIKEYLDSNTIIDDERLSLTLIVNKLLLLI